MSTVALRDVPARFLDSRKWAELRSFAKRELIALTYINGPFPDEDNPSDFFWGRDGSFDEAVHCYRTGRALLKECRLLLVQRRLVATGLRPDRDRNRKRVKAYLDARRSRPWLRPARHTER